MPVQMERVARAGRAEELAGRDVVHGVLAARAAARDRAEHREHGVLAVPAPEARLEDNRLRIGASQIYVLFSLCIVGFQIPPWQLNASP